MQKPGSVKKERRREIERLIYRDVPLSKPVLPSETTCQTSSKVIPEARALPWIWNKVIEEASQREVEEVSLLCGLTHYTSKTSALDLTITLVSHQ